MRNLLKRALLTLAFCMPLAGAASGHAVATATEPADGAVLAAPPERIRVTFNEPVALIAAQVLDAGEATIVTTAQAAIRDGALEVDMPVAMPSGTYIASYRVVSLDGHPVSGSFVFSVGAPSSAPAKPQPSDAAWRVIWTVVRATLDGGLMAGGGGVLFLLLIAPARNPESVRIVQWSAAIGAIAAIFSIGVQGGLLSGAPLSEIGSAVMWRTGLGSTFGRAALVAFAGLLLMLTGLTRASPFGRAVASAGALIGLSSFSLAGHVVTAGPRWLTAPILLAHTSCVAFWVGSLLPLRAALAQEGAAPLLRRFSRLAVLAVTIMVGAGFVIAALQMRGIAPLFTTTYGLTLLAKLALVAALLLLAAANKWRLTPALARGDPDAAGTLRKTIASEIMVVAAILTATAALGTTPPPRALTSEHLHSPEHHAGREHHAHGLSLEMASGSRVARLELASAHAGPNDVEVRITDDGGNPMNVKEVTISAANAAAGVEPIRRSAVLVEPGLWRVEGLVLAPPGRWAIVIDALVSDFEKTNFDGEVTLQ